MTTTLTITGPTFTSTVQPRLPSITNLRTVAFFGTGGDNINTNRQAGGPAIAIQSGTPVYATNYVSLGQQVPATRWDVLNTANPWRVDAPSMALGFTWCNVIRMATAPANSTSAAFSDTNGTSQPQSFLAYQTNNVAAGQQKLSIATGATIRGSIVQIVSIINSWHFVAQTYTGGGTGTVTLYDFTENNTTGVPATWPAASFTATIGAQSPHIGTLTTSEGAATQSIESAFFLVAASVLDAPTLAQVYAWAKANLARRSITI